MKRLLGLSNGFDSSLTFLRSATATEAGSKWFELECISSTKECNGEPNISCVTVFECLGLHEFLEQLSQFAHLIVFTADLEDYARPLVDEIDTKHVLNNRLYQPFVLSACKLNHVKDLLCASKNLCRTVIVDNNPYSFLLQPNSMCVGYGFDPPPRPTEYYRTLFFHFLSNFQKKKTSDNDRFHMPDWFEKQGIPWSCWTSSSSLQVPESR
ncbi:hypothetical protein Bca52824_042899 [Brassica carinata]|uniref:Mitochondrial import inner membrane translocase subunit TIM50 n=1 Tax=Brassica carinata TaxID=52824 RepID=A0A8X7S037_BRACI|nr:hypothetical protein Bca52824_042899 [Brassica carinata]